MAPRFKAFVDVQVRFRDTDAMGHVNNAVYLTYLEVARMRYWETLTGQKGYKSVDFILARAEIDYRSQGLVHEDLRVWIRMSEARRSSFVFEYRVEERGSGRLVAEARTVQACFDYARGKIKRLDPAFMKKVLDFEGPDQVLTPAGR